METVDGAPVETEKFFTEFGRHMYLFSSLVIELKTGIALGVSKSRIAAEERKLSTGTASNVRA